jgi:hypothetical protein
MTSDSALRTFFRPQMDGGTSSSLTSSSIEPGTGRLKKCGRFYGNYEMLDVALAKLQYELR